MNSKPNSVRSSSVMVWDPLVRLFHWSLVVGFFTSYFADGDWMNAHIWAGYFVSVWVLIRVLWGFVGSEFARFQKFVFTPSVIFGYLKDVLFLRAKRYIGHNPAGGAMIILLLLCVLTTTVSGMMLYGADAWLGPLAGLMKNVEDGTADTLKVIHEYSANGTIALVVVHVLGVLWESVLHRENLVKSMFTGLKRSE
jgi:cytochrome b